LPRRLMFGARTTAVAWMLGVLLCGLAANTAGHPFYHNPSRHPGLGYTGNDFGWPYTYLTTCLDAKQEAASRLPDDSVKKPHSIALPRQELVEFVMSEEPVVCLNTRRAWQNAGVIVVICLECGLCGYLLSRLRPELSSRSLGVLLLLVVATLVGTRSGLAHLYLYIPWYQLWQFAPWLALGVPAGFAVAAGFSLRQSAVK